MSDKTLSRARGLNSIADPADFKGSKGRRARKPVDTPNAPESNPDEPVHARHIPLDTPNLTQSPPNGDAGEAKPSPADAPAPEAKAAETSSVARPTPVRKRRELSVPLAVAEAVEATGINAADVVMAAYRKHGDAVYTGTGGRMVARGRKRLRLSISDTEFEQLTRLGQARGWNRSETVAVLLTLELVNPPSDQGPAGRV